MIKVTRHPRIVEATIDSDVTIIGQRFVEYFNDPGKFYPEDCNPTGIGVYFQNRKMSNKDWFDQGFVRNIETVHFKETKWWAVVKTKLLDDLQALLREKENINGKINDLEMILFDPITYYAKD